MPHVYIAGPYETQDQIEFLRTIEGLLDQCRISYFSPRKYMNDRQELDDCSLVLACLDNQDMMTAWELGYAHGNATPIIGLYENEDRVIDLPFQKYCMGFVLGIDSIVNLIRSIRRGPDFNFLFDVDEIHKWKKGVTR